MIRFVTTFGTLLLVVVAPVLTLIALNDSRGGVTDGTVVSVQNSNPHRAFKPVQPAPILGCADLARPVECVHGHSS